MRQYRPNYMRSPPYVTVKPNSAEAGTSRAVLLFGRTLARRLVLRPKFQILWAVVVPNAVLVMNVLPGKKKPPKDFLHDQSVLKDVKALGVGSRRMIWRVYKDIPCSRLDSSPALPIARTPPNIPFRLGGAGSAKPARTGTIGGLMVNTCKEPAVTQLAFCNVSTGSRSPRSHEMPPLPPFILDIVRTVAVNQASGVVEMGGRCVGNSLMASPSRASMAAIRECVLGDEGAATLWTWRLAPAVSGVMTLLGAELPVTRPPIQELVPALSALPH